MPNTLLKLWFWLGFYMKIVGDWIVGATFFVNLQVLIIRYFHEQSSIYLINCFESLSKSFPCGSASKEPACNAGDLGLIPGLARSPGEGKGYLLQYSGLENPKDCIVHGVTKSQTWLSNFRFPWLSLCHKSKCKSAYPYGSHLAVQETAYTYHNLPTQLQQLLLP